MVVLVADVISLESARGFREDGLGGLACGLSVGIVLTALMDVGRPRLKWASPFPVWGPQTT